MYTKAIRLVGNQSKMVTEHHLKSTGLRAIAMPLYDHNCLRIDGLGVGSDYSITVPYAIKSTRLPVYGYSRDQIDQLSVLLLRRRSHTAQCFL